MKTWFFAGASGGFGRAWSIAALERGDRVVAAARNPTVLDDLEERFGEQVVVLAFDLTDREAVFATVAAAFRGVERIDVIVNCGGYGIWGMVEEVTEAQLRAVFETNFFGAVSLTQAALPFLRDQGGGHVILVSSVGGVVSYPGLGAYHATKWALEGLCESLAREVAGFGIRLTLIEPGGFDTGAPRASVQCEPLSAYDDSRRQAMQQSAGRQRAPGDPNAAAVALLRLVDADQPPLRVLFGRGLVDQVTEEYEERIATWRAWQWLSDAAQGGHEGPPGS